MAINGFTRVGTFKIGHYDIILNGKSAKVSRRGLLRGAFTISELLEKKWWKGYTSDYTLASMALEQAMK